MKVSRGVGEIVFALALGFYAAGPRRLLGEAIPSHQGMRVSS